MSTDHRMVGVKADGCIINTQHRVNRVTVSTLLSVLEDQLLPGISLRRMYLYCNVHDPHLIFDGVLIP